MGECVVSLMARLLGTALMKLFPREDSDWILPSRSYRLLTTSRSLYHLLEVHLTYTVLCLGEH